MNKKLIADSIDHTLLKPDAGLSQIHKLCAEAITYGFHAICVNPCLVKEATNYLINSSVQICSVVGFPLGTNTSTIKLREIDTCLNDGANEIDMVMNIGHFKDKKLKEIAEEFKEAKKK